MRKRDMSTLFSPDEFESIQAELAKPFYVVHAISGKPVLYNQPLGNIRTMRARNMYKKFLMHECGFSKRRAARMADTSYNWSRFAQGMTSSIAAYISTS